MPRRKLTVSIFQKTPNILSILNNTWHPLVQWATC